MPFSYADALLPALGGAVALIGLHLLAGALRGGGRTPRARAGILVRLLFLAVLVCGAVLASTALYAVLAHGALHGWLLLVHTGAGGGLTVTLALYALLAAPGSARLGLAARAAFWLLLASGLVAGATMLLSTLPLFATAALERLLELHRWSGLSFALALLLHAYLVAMGRLGRA